MTKKELFKYLLVTIIPGGTILVAIALLRKWRKNANSSN